MDLRGQKRGNATHQSTADPESRLFNKKGELTKVKLRYMTHALAENRAGLFATFTGPRPVGVPNGKRLKS